LADLTCKVARLRALRAVYKAIVHGLPTLADSGYEGAGIGVHTPARKRPGSSHDALHADNRTYNQLLRGIRSLGERAAAELKERWRALKHITLSPNRIVCRSKSHRCWSNGVAVLVDQAAEESAAHYSAAVEVLHGDGLFTGSGR
jgi:hypothetical protein